MLYDAPTASGKDEDLPVETVRSAKKKSRFNAIIFGAVLLLFSLAPDPWRSYAPLLFVIPIVKSVFDRLSQASSTTGSLKDQLDPRTGRSVGKQIRTHVPKDPKDPRRYKPIG